jgi:quercetin dioxygenase-like cupin family protein
MIHKKNADILWTDEKQYARGVMFPYHERPHDHVQVQLTRIVPGNYVPKHYHKQQTEFIYCLEGRSIFYFEKETITVKKGDLVIIEPGDIHAAKNDGDETAVLVTFKLNGTQDDSVWVEAR